ncbi:clc channel [Obelidium mucronatum]|nr:clc channel [Obelidium mucronatum]
MNLNGEPVSDCDCDDECYSDTISILEKPIGLKAWYSDYSSIDWTRDLLKERERIRSLRRLVGHEGMVANIWDSLQGWILLLLIGVSVGTVASFIDIGESMLYSWRDGVCATSIWRTRDACCASAAVAASIIHRNHSEMNQSQLGRILAYQGDATLFMLHPSSIPLTKCPNWIPWSKSLGTLPDFIIYVFSALLFAFISTSITGLSAIVKTDRETGKTSLKYQAAGGGISEIKTILGGFVIRGFLGVRTLLVKIFGLIFSVSSGITVGQQGPNVHVSNCIGNILCRFFPKYADNEGKKREILSAATAAGVSVAFAAPIGGVLFSLEEVSYYFPLKTMWRSFFCTLTAVVTLKILNPYGSGKLVKFQVSYSRDWKDFELVPFALLGLVGGTYGALFIRFTNILASWRRKKFYPHPIVEVLLVAGITALVNHQTPLMRLGLNEIKEVLFSECVPGQEDAFGICNTDDLGGVISILMSALAFKTFLVLFSNGLRIPGGIVGSSMLIGACFGRIAGTYILKLQQDYGAQCSLRNDCATPGIYALVGGAAALCGVSRMTVSLVVVMVELTGALKLVLPLMVAIMVSKWTADKITIDSSYDATIKRNGFPYLDHKKNHFTSPTSEISYAGDVAEYDVLATFQVELEYSWEEVQEKMALLAHINDGGFAVLNGDALVGYIAYDDIQRTSYLAQRCHFDHKKMNFFFHDPSTPVSPSHRLQPSQLLRRIDLCPWMDQAPLTVSTRMSMDLVVQLFTKMGCKTVCVVDGAGGGAGKFVGVLSKKQVIALTNGNH